MQTLTLTRPDDWHLHLRDEEALNAVLPHTAAQFARAIVMPNLKLPVTSVALAQSYRERILASRPKDSAFTPLMTLYLTDKTPVEEIYRAKETGFIPAVKLYPQGATTHSENGVTDIHQLNKVSEALIETGTLLLIHGEVTDNTVDIFDRERVFIADVLTPLLARHPKLRVVLEHITTRDAVEFVENTSYDLAATITPHHLLLNRNDVLAGGIRPHHYCLPIVKRESHRQALLKAATSGNPRFFAGTDSAPHAQSAKESPCGCAGIYSAHAAVEFYAKAFEEANALDKLEAFISFYGADFYGLARNLDTITLVKENWTVPTHYPLGESQLIPFWAGQTLSWKVR